MIWPQIFVEYIVLHARRRDQRIKKVDNYELMAKSQFLLNSNGYFSKNWQKSASHFCCLLSLSTGLKSVKISVVSKFKLFIAWHWVHWIQRHRKMLFDLNGGDLTPKIRQIHYLYARRRDQILKFHRISSSGLAIILGKKSAKIAFFFTLYSQSFFISHKSAKY